MYSDKSLSETFAPEISEQCFYHDRSLEISVHQRLKLHKHIILAFRTVLVIDSRERRLEHVPHTCCSRAIVGIWLLLVGLSVDSRCNPRRMFRSVDGSLGCCAKSFSDPRTGISHVSSFSITMSCICMSRANSVEARKLP
jgi:hypothetical protein